MDIIIRPNSRLKYFFWSDPYRLPKNDKVLEIFSKKGIKFVVALGRHTMNAKCYNRIQKLIDYNVGINVCILDKDFAHLDNSHTFIEIYKNLRNSKIFNYSKEIYIDAEISSTYRRCLKALPFNKKFTYVFENYPKKNEILKSIKDYNYLLEMVKNDGKKFGVIRAITAGENIENLAHNVPIGDINKDLYVSMVYRTPEGRKKGYTDSWFYFNAKREGDNIFIGAIKDEYRSLKKDITICSYLKKKRVYIYDYYGFKKFYNHEDLKPYKSYKLKKDAWEFVKHKVKFSSIDLADKFLKFFK